jgi:anti-anti-sigma regulatory factor
MPLKARIPSDPLIHLIFELNRTERPEWEERVKKWMRKNGIELEE